MLNHDHPDDERLSALAAGDTDASGDASLTTHVTTCDRCAGVVRELGVLTAALADLPDVAPHRPLRLIPPVDGDAVSAPDSLGQWARRLFAPVLTAGAALAMVGMVGTALPTLGGMGSQGAGGAAPSDGGFEMAAEDSAAPGAGNQTDASAGSELSAPAPSERIAATATDGGDMTTQGADGADEETGEVARDSFSTDPLTAERSPWPMVLFAGVALMIAAALLRWILVPRLA